MARKDPFSLWIYLYFPTEIVVTSKELPPNLLLQTSTLPKNAMHDVSIGRVFHIHDGLGSEYSEVGNADLAGIIKELISNE